jgi:hypothetical protein
MIFVFLDDSGLDVINNDTDDLCGAYEGIDVEDGAYSFFDEHLRKLHPSFLTPNKVEGLFVQSGTYMLQPGEEDKSGFIARLNGVTHVNPNQWFKTVDDIRKYIEKAP